jgi:uncharacterized protein YdaT
MTWDETYYPSSMRNLPLKVRLKAIEIANALLEEAYEESKAIRIAIARQMVFSGTRLRSLSQSQVRQAPAALGAVASYEYE